MHLLLVIDLGSALHQIIEVPYPEQFYFKVKTPLQFACDSRRMKNKFTSKTVKFSMACSLRLLIFLRAQGYDV
jgi:hypothetical protein